MYEKLKTREKRTRMIPGFRVTNKTYYEVQDIAKEKRCTKVEACIALIEDGIVRHKRMAKK